MATTSQRRLQPTSIRHFGTGLGTFELPDLTALQTDSYAAFLQADVDPKKRKNQGLESVLREIFPISSYDGNTTLEYLYYELGKPRYTSQECRQLRLTYGRPLRIWLRLNREEPHEEEVYLGDLPIMMGGVSSSSTAPSASWSASCTAAPASTLFWSRTPRPTESCPAVA